MSEKIYNKLVRDKIPQVITAGGSTPVVSILSTDEFVAKLKEKLVEEASEVVGAATRKELIGELADMTEVANMLMRVADISSTEVEVARQAKADDRGGFEDKILLEKVIEG